MQRDGKTRNTESKWEKIKYKKRKKIKRTESKEKKKMRKGFGVIIY